MRWLEFQRVYRTIFSYWAKKCNHILKARWRPSGHPGPLNVLLPAGTLLWLLLPYILSTPNLNVITKICLGVDCHASSNKAANGSGGFDVGSVGPDKTETYA